MEAHHRLPGHLGQMFAPSTEKAFRRFRRTGDAASLALVFDRTAPDLLKLGRHLASGEAAAEDLVQDTFLTAMRAAQDYDEALPVLPWLVGILANHARSARRRARRQLDTDRLRLDPAADPAAEAAGRELVAQVEQCIADLPESWRPVLDSYLLRGAAPAAIAQRLGRSPSTVRVQITRGLRLLRGRLPAAGAVAAVPRLQVAPRGLDAVREAVLGPGAPTGLTAATPAAGAGALLGALAVVAAAAAVTVVQWPTAAATTDPQTQAQALAAVERRTPAAPDAAGQGRSPVAPTDPAALAAPERAAALAPGLLLRGVVVDPGGEPVAFARVRTRGERSGRGIHAETVAETGEDGRFSVTVPTNRLEVHAEAAGKPRSAAQTVIARRGSTVDLRLELGAVGHRVAVRVLGPVGRAALDATARLIPAKGPPFDLRLDTEGRLAARQVPTGAYVLVVHSDDDRHAADVRTLEVAADVDLRVELDESAEVRGQLAGYTPAHGLGYVVARRLGEPLPMASMLARYYGVPRTALDADGGFALTGLRAGRYNLTLQLHRGGFWAQLEITIAAGEQHPWSPRIDQGFALRVPEEIVPRDPRVALYRPAADGTRTLLARLATDQRGRVVFAGVPAGRYDAAVSVPVGTSLDSGMVLGRYEGIPLGEGEPLLPAQPAMLPHGTIRGQVLAADGTPLDNTRVVAHPEDGWPREAGVLALTDQAGWFHLPGLPLGTWRLSTPGLAAPPARATLAADGDVVEIVPFRPREN